MPNLPEDINNSKFSSTGYVNDKSVKSILRDTGCTSIIVSSKILSVSDVSETVTLLDYFGRRDTFPLVNCSIKCLFFTGGCKAIIAILGHCDVIIGNVIGATELDSSKCNTARVSAVNY